MKNEQLKNTDSLGSRIKRIRLNHGLTVQEFANKIGASKSGVSKWENNVTIPSPQYLKKIAQLGDTTADGLLGLGDNQSAQPYMGYDLGEMLRSNLPISYNGKPITAREKEKLNAIVEAFLK